MSEGLIRGMGEFSLIEALFPRSETEPEGVRLGLGDDAAVLTPASDRDWVWTVDTVVEGIHTCLASEPKALGWKGIAVNVSDLAAMGARPCYALVAAYWPQDLAYQRATRIAEGIHTACREWGITLVGGDTVATPGPLSLSITLLGEITAGCALQRSTACVGDGVYVTGTLGDAAAGLELLGNPDTARNLDHEWLIERHLWPYPPLSLGQVLSRLASAAIDLSDGLIADLRHLAAASGVGIDLDLARLPFSTALTEWVKGTGRDPQPLALEGGEDFELIFTAPDTALEGLQDAARQTGTRLTAIGRVVAGPAGEVTAPGPPALLHGGYDHFGGD